MRFILPFILLLALPGLAPAKPLADILLAETSPNADIDDGGRLDAVPEDDAIGGMKDIPIDDWREMVRGRTVTYSIGGDVWARETYDTGSDTVWIRLADGTCMDGVWTWNDGVYCYAWSSGEFSCFRHVRSQGSILVIPVLEDGTGLGTIQTVTQISDVPASCGPELTS